MSATIINRVEKINFLINGVVNSYLVIDQNLKLLSPLLSEEEVYSSWDYTEGVDGVAAMRMALYSHILSDIRAIMFDGDPKVASMYNIMKALEDQSVVKHLKEIFCKPGGVNVAGEHTEEEKEWITKSIQEEDVSRKTDGFESTLLKLTKDYQKLKNSDLGVRINDARSRMISHKQVTSAKTERKLYDAEDFGLKFGDAKDIVDSSSGIIFGAYLLITRSGFDTKSFTNHHELVATKFWRKGNA